MWEKQNLVTLKDGSDVYKCSLCGHKKKYFSLFRDSRCPKCNDGIKIGTDTVYGLWGIPSIKHICRWCYSDLIICPKKNHPNAKFWELKRNDGNELLVCPNGCSENGSFIFRVKAS